MRIVSLFLISFLLISDICAEMKLKQVVILSRHNVRTPLAKNLGRITPKTWPQWKEKSGYLTQKGALLEGYMGVFFSAWLKKQGLLTEACPAKEEIYVYANIKQRTKASAQAFVDKAFPGCNVTVHHSDSNKIDPIFNPIIHNTSAIFKQIAIEEMQACLKSLHLNSSYEDISNILDYKDSEICKKEKSCDLVKDKNKIVDVAAGKKPSVIGPLNIGKSAIDSFVMEFYEGFRDVAWGCLTTHNEWQKIMKLSRGYHNVIFNTTYVAKDISAPLLKYMSETFLNDTYKPKVILLMSHDANMYTVMDAMDFVPYTLQNQYEITPVGGKIVFQRWSDTIGKDFLKVNYIYQSSLQLRKGVALSLENPPQFAKMQLNNCRTNDDGFCPWQDFVKLLKSLL